MISFACKTIDVRDIVLCSFDLTKTEYGILAYLLQQPEPLPITTIAQANRLERSTVQKSIVALLARGLVERRQINHPGGGYRYIYAVIERDDIKQRIRTIVDGWHKKVLEAVQGW